MTDYVCQEFGFGILGASESLASAPSASNYPYAMHLYLHLAQPELY